MSLLKETLQAKRALQAVLFTLDPTAQTYSVSTAVGFSDAVIALARKKLVFRIGEERGLIGWVAARRESWYVPDCAAEPRWIEHAAAGPIGSGYVVPVVVEDGVPAVLCAVSPCPSGFDPEQRTLVDCLLDLVSRACAFEIDFRARLGRLEQQMRDVALGWGALRARLAVNLPGSLHDRLRTVSPREWEVVERLHAGQRIATIARELAISPNTVRNHVKSISKKLGVRSQDELREYIGVLHLGKGPHVVG